MGAGGRALVGLGLIALTACGSVRIVDKTAVATDYVSWAPLTPTGIQIEAPTVPPSPPYPIPDGTPSCTASQLEGTLAYTGGSGGGNSVLTILFRDKASTDCVVDGFPDVSVLDAAGNLLAAAKGNVGKGTFFNDGPVVRVLAKAGTPSLRPTGFGDPDQRILRFLAARQAQQPDGIDSHVRSLCRFYRLLQTVVTGVVDTVGDKQNRFLHVLGLLHVV